MDLCIPYIEFHVEFLVLGAVALQFVVEESQ